MADCVEEVGDQIGVYRVVVPTVRDGCAARGSSQVWDRYQLRQLAEVLGGCCEEELVAGTLGAAQSKPIELEDAFEMGEQHLDLLAQSARHVALPRLGDRTRPVTRSLVD